MDSDGRAFPRKRFWGWVKLLFVPAAILGIGLAVSSQISHDNEIAAANEAARETSLENYFDGMNVLLHENLNSSSDQRSEQVLLANSLTRTVLPGLDTDRKTEVLRFLNDAGIIRLISFENLDLHGTCMCWGADLHGANLSGANLSGADLYLDNLSDANLSGANLSGALLSASYLNRANLSGANLSGAYVKGADFSGADLSYADLSHAIVTDAAQLSAAKDLTGATLPDWPTHE